jgi:hypothetical protein
VAEENHKMLRVFARADLVPAGLSEDGEAQVDFAAYLVAEARDGRRWAHDHSVRSPWEADALAGIAALEARVAAAVAAGRPLDPAHWVEIDAAYGSAAYQALDAVGYYRAQERRVAYDAGEAVDFGRELADLYFA